MLVPLEAKSGLLGFVELSSVGKHVGVGMKTSSSGCSFAEVVRATTSYAANFGGVKTLLLGHLHLFLVAECFEWANGREELRLAVDCFEVEKQLKKAESRVFSSFARRSCF